MAFLFQKPSRLLMNALWTLILSFAPGTLAGCSENSPPRLSPVSDQAATVGQEMSILIEGQDSDGDALSFSLSVPSITDIHDRVHPPAFEPFGNTSAYLRWTPMAMDVGSHEFTVKASDGSAQRAVTFTVTVQAGNAVPVFREPLGSGTTLNLAEQDCIDVDVVVDDPDSPDVDIYLEQPIEDGYEFSQDDPFAGTFSWCPTEKQIDRAERYTLNLAADDRDGHVASKKYVLVLRRKLENTCPGEPPVISHTPPGDQETLLDIQLSAQITDDQGLGGLPVLYYSLVEPADPSNPDFAQFVQVITDQVTGDGLDGQYVGTVPNPVVNEQPGTSQTIYYFFEATDDDDSEGSCDHRTTDPVDNVHAVTVTRPSGSGETLDVCDPCWTDVQCGDSALCIALGGGQSYCLETCTAPDDCYLGLSCSSQSLTSVDNTASTVCVPDTGSCVAECEDDIYEDNDSLTDPNVETLGEGQYANLKLCGDSASGMDEDYFAFELTESTFFTTTLLFSHAEGDVDLSLLDANGDTIASSYSVTDNEQVTECLQPGIYYVNIYSFSLTIDASYDMVLTIPGGGCCVDDSYEEDDGPADAHNVVDGDLFEDMQICEYDDDWFAISLNSGDTVVVDALFDQNEFDQDLDIYFYDTDGTTLLSDYEDGGQTGNSDEHLEYTVTTAGTYYVVIAGFLDSENSYMVGFTVE
jgi:hypothetical protein